MSGLSAAKRVVRRLSLGEDPVHAVLFYGLPGSGKASLARLLARAWLCAHPGDGGDPCGECKACGAFERGNCLDVLEIEPKPPSRLIRQGQIAPSETGDKEELSLIDFLRTPPLTAKRKIVILHEADRMNRDAANAFLKTLEEPPPFAKIVATTDAIGSVLPTIRSRFLCVQCDVPLAREFGGDAELEEIGIALNATPGLAMEIDRRADRYRALYRFARNLNARRVEEAVAVSDEFKALCEGLRESKEDTARGAYAEGVGVLAAFLLALGQGPRSSGPLADVHRAILGNGSASILLDAFFMRYLLG